MPPQWIRQRRQRCSSNPAPIREPQIRIPRRRGQHKRLGESNQDLTGHSVRKLASILGLGGRPGVADPVAE